LATVSRFELRGRGVRFFCRWRDHTVIAGLWQVQAFVIVAQPLDTVVRRLEEFVRNQDDGHPQTRLEFGDVGALFV
jgi:hypothetical protein